jgi:hypothetical protein
MIDNSEQWVCTKTEAIAGFEVAATCVTPETPVPTRARRGTTVMEYVLILSLIVSVCLVAVGYFGQSNSTVSSGVSDSLSKSMNKGKGNGNGNGNAYGKGNGKG